MDTESIWFQQDGATTHTAKMSMDVIPSTIPGRLVSRNGDVPWPPRSPDLTPCDFFLWGYLKSEVYVNRLWTLLDLKNAIKRDIESIPVEMSDKVMKNFGEGLQKCIDVQGRRLSDILFHK